MGFCFSWCCYENRKPYGKKHTMTKIYAEIGNNTEKQQQIYSTQSQVCRNIWGEKLYDDDGGKKQRSETFFKQKIWILVRFWLFFFGFLVRLDLHLSFCYWHIRTIVERVKFKIIMDRVVSCAKHISNAKT